VAPLSSETESNRTVLASTIMVEEFYHSRAGAAANRRAHSQWHNKERSSRPPMTPEGTNQPATKQDLDHAVESITSAIRAEIRAEIQAAEDRAQEFAR
jgi:hypothetical protein